MSKKSARLRFSRLIFSLFIPSSLLLSNPSEAQITTDGTTATNVTSDGNTQIINGGDTAENNLFHSFRDFSVPTNGEAFFNNASNIANIFSRVTGGSVSNIDGLIRANGSANLFLINPAGIIFGPGASLNIGGSFYGSSADSILFPNDIEFIASDSQNRPILTVNAPIGLGIRDNPGEIVNQSVANNNGLQVAPGETLALIGGNVRLDEGIIFVPGGSIELGGLSAAGEIGLNEDGSLSFPTGVPRGNVSLANGSIVNTLGGGGDSITINARNFELLTGSVLIGGIGNGLGSADAQAGDITISATEDISLDEGDSNSLTVISSTIENNAVGNAGNINISTRNISFANGGAIFNIASGFGDGGNITVNAIENIAVDGIGVLTSGINNFVNTGGVGSTGSVNVNSSNLSITNGARIGSLVAGEGNTGDIDISAINNIVVDGAGQQLASGIFSNVFSTGVGDVGNINVSTSNLSITNGGIIQADTLGIGNAGNINVIANSINLDGGSFVPPNQISGVSLSQISSNVLSSEARGNAGNITITTNSLTATNGGRLGASTNGRGNSGTIAINASESVSFEGRFNEDLPSGIFSSVLPDGIGAGGIINVNTREFSLSNGAQISSFTRGQGNGGIINIDVTDTASFSDGNIFATVDESGRGNGGSINITVGSLFATNGSQFDSSTRGQGNAGNVLIKATDTISFDGEDATGFNSGVLSSVTSGAVGNAGNIELETNNLFVTNGAQISSSVFGTGDVGNITINADNSIFLDGQGVDGFFSGVFSTVQETGVGNAGNINITTDSLEIANGGAVTVSSLGEGNGGSIFIQAESITLDSGGGILASTAFGSGGNITLEVEDAITLRERGEISAQAFGDSNGGNITISADVIVAFLNQDNDIIASAEQGNGGNISIETEGIFGLEERSSTPDNETNDIDVRSQDGLDGSISIETPDVDSTQGLIELTTKAIEPQDTVAQVCSSPSRTIAASTFNITGKGGVPPLLTAPLTADAVYLEGEPLSLQTKPEDKEEKEDNFVTLVERDKPISLDEIEPAMGAIVLANGDVILTAYPIPNATARNPHNSANCSS